MFLKLFGNPVLQSDADELPLACERRFQVLAYLACQDKWVPRDQLTALCWPAHSGEDARRNLRRLLHDIRRLSWLTGFESRGDSLRWQVPSDLGAFSAASARGDWAAAIAAVDGPLLEGMEQNAATSFCEWLHYERELQVGRWRDAVSRRREEIRAEPVVRVELAQHVLRHDAHNEAALKDLVEALCLLGREDEARGASRAFAQHLKDDLGIEPTLQLRAIMAGEFGAQAQQSIEAVAAPDQGGRSSSSHAFVGRRLEQTELTGLLTKDDCRSVTIHGPGGVGKSSLALAAPALLAAHFPDGIHWVGLQDMSGVAQIPARIAESCGFKLAMSQDALDSVACRIGDGRRLLIFDNCEHLPEIRAVDDLLLARCGGLKILHTSRARIGNRGEWVLPLAGLPLPDAGETEVEVLRAFDSIRLFEMRAREAEPRFDLQRHAGEVVALVRTLEGLPLALELAAACVRLLPVGEILRDLSRLMSVPHPAQDGGQRSLRAGFEHSWRLLTASEQTSLSQLAVFGAGFSLAAAHHVAGTELAVIGSLVDKSLVNSDGQGRFSLHPLVRQLAMEQLRDEPVVRQRHAAYFAQAMVARTSGNVSVGRMWGDEDMLSCIEAWRWASAQRLVPLLQQMAMPLIRLFGLYLRWQEGIETLGATLQGLDSRESQAETLRATLLYGMARCHLYHGELDAAEATARQSLRTCRSMHIGDVASGNLHTIGYTLAWRGEPQAARRFLDQSLKRALAEQDAESIAKARYGIAFLEQVAGNWAEARALLTLNDMLCRQAGLYHWLGLTLNGLGAICLSENRPAEAIALFDEGIQICAAHDVNLTRSFLMTNRGLALIRQGELEQAGKSIAKALAEAQHWNVKTAGMQAHLASCNLALAEDRCAQALPHLQRAMILARQTQSPLRLLTVSRYWGEWLIKSGESTRGMAVLEFVRAQTRTMQKDRLASDRLIAAQSPSMATRGAARNAARGLSLDGLERDVQSQQI